MRGPTSSLGQQSKKLRVILPIMVVGLAVVGAQLLISSGPTVPKSAREVKPTFVEILTAHVQDDRAVILAFGTVQAHQRLMVQPEVAGRVVQLNPHVVIGGILRMGEALLQIDPRDYRFAVDEERAALAKAEFDLKVELGNQAVALREWNLLKPSIGEISDLSKQLALRRPHLKEKQIALEAAKSQLQKAQLDLERTVIRASINSLVLRESVEMGQLLTRQSTVATLVGTDEFRVQVSVPIRQLDWMTFSALGQPQGSRVRVFREIGNGEFLEREGRVVELLGDVTENGRMAQVLVSVPDPLELTRSKTVRRPLLLGEYVRVEIEGPILHDVFVLPREVIREGQRVWIQNAEDRLEIRPVEILWSRKDTVVIANGVRAGDRIIINQLPAAIPGLLVKSAGEPSPTPPMPPPLSPKKVAPSTSTGSSSE